MCNTINRLTVLHIAYVANDFTSGVSTVVPQYLEAQASNGSIEIALLNLTPYKLSTSKYQVFSQIPMKDLPTPFCNPSLVVFHEIYRPEFPKIAAELRKRAIPYIVTPHGSLTKVAQQHKQLQKSLLNKLFFNSFIRHAKCIHFLSDKEKESSAAFQYERSIVIPNGIKIPNTCLNRKRRPTATFIGRLDIEVKGLDLLINSLPLIADELRSINASVNIYGPDENGSSEKLKQLIEDNQISDLAFLKGPIEGTLKSSVLQDSSFYVQLSRTEAFGISILEALSYGLPIVVTEGTTWKELANDKGIGLGVDSNLRDIAHAILTLFENTEMRDKMSHAALNYVTSNYQWQQIAAKQISLYRDIACCVLR